MHENLNKVVWNEKRLGIIQGVFGLNCYQLFVASGKQS